MANTKDIILNTAEKLFAEKGFHNTSVRDITGEAKANISAINYHFGSKEKLFNAVISRRLIPINEKRIEMLNNIIVLSRAKELKPDPRDIINAFFEPIWDLMIEDENAKYFLMIIGTIFQDSDTHLRNKFIDIMKPVALSFFDQICQATPHLKHNEIFLRLQLSLGAFHQGFRIMFHPNHKDDIQKLHHLMLPSKEEYYSQIIDYITKGLTL